MSKPIQINIPNPCHEDWNKMTPAEQGRFCNSCQKTVVDLRNYSDTQLYNYIQQHKGESICGRLYATQLNRSIHIPYQPHSRLYRYFIWLGLALIFTQAPTEQLHAKAPYTYNSFNAASNDSTKTKRRRAKHINDTTKYYVIDGRKYKIEDIHQQEMSGSLEYVDITLPGTPASSSGTIDKNVYVPKPRKNGPRNLDPGNK
ncbi:MAG: hypothetical protein JST70_18250 [Bacteroidetes bacterium]|nr:hypothetical protein [Bacteroidota bacterium]